MIHMRHLLSSGIVAITLFSATSLITAQTPPATPKPAADGYVPHDVPQPPYKHLTQGPQTLNPGDWPAHWPYIDEYDAVVAAPEVHRLRYTDGNVRFVEVAYFPGVKGQMHGHPYPSVFGTDAPNPHDFNVSLDEERRPIAAFGKAPVGATWPTCSTMGPQAPHAETNQDTFPHHFYRLDFVHLDGNAIQQHWREWYPRQADTVRVANAAHPAGPKFSDGWPFPIAYDTYRAAPNNYRLLFEDDHVRLLEVSIRPGETTPMAGDPYMTVVAFDSVTGGPAPQERLLDSKSPLNGQGSSSVPDLPGFDGLSCTTSNPRAPRTIHNGASALLHYYQIDFKRIDGEGIRTHWREWYPSLGQMTDSYAAHPYTPNYH